jgi:hypothetical protein
MTPLGIAKARETRERRKEHKDREFEQLSSAHDRTMYQAVCEAENWLPNRWVLPHWILTHRGDRARRLLIENETLWGFNVQDFTQVMRRVHDELLTRYDKHVAYVNVWSWVRGIFDTPFLEQQAELEKLVFDCVHPQILRKAKRQRV